MIIQTEGCSMRKHKNVVNGGAVKVEKQKRL
jgi:hypothetical protein